MHLFAGVGGGLLADLILGHRPIVAVEWEPYACQVLRERAREGWFPDLSVWEGDVRLFDPSEYAGKVDCIHAGFPCQDISTAGKQAGVGPETRSGLYREVLRIAGVVRPKQLFLENVSAIVSNGLGTVLNDLASLGYDSEWLCLRASDCGANHHRDRWWLLANSNSPRMEEHGARNAGLSVRSSPTRASEEQEKTGVNELLAHAKHDGQFAAKRKHCRNKQDSRGAKEQSCTEQFERGCTQPCVSKDLAHSNNDDGWGEASTEPFQRETRVESWCSSADVSYSECFGLQGQGEYVATKHSAQGRNWETVEFEHGCSSDFWATEPILGRVANGVPNRVHRLKGLGNAQVPLQAAVAYKLLGGT